MDKFRAYRIDQQDGKVVAGFQELTVDDLTAGNVVVKVSYSTINYKDALAATGAGKILRTFPLNGGIDLAGRVVSSEDAEFQPGTPVLVNGCGLSETVDGGYSEYARVDSQSLVPIPEGLDARQAMQIGTAGYTAALAIHRMEQNGQLPENGPIVVTGATGGVGSIAVDMLAGRGSEVAAMPGRSRQAADGEGAVGRGHRQSGRRLPYLADTHDELRGKYCERRSCGEPCAEYHGTALHTQGRLPARHQFRRHATGAAARRLVADCG